MALKAAIFISPSIHSDEKTFFVQCGQRRLQRDVIWIWNARKGRCGLFMLCAPHLRCMYIVPFIQAGQPSSRHPLQTGTPALSLRMRTLSPFFNSAAMMAGFPLRVTLDPFISILSLFSIFVSCRSMNHSGPRWIGIVSFSVLSSRWIRPSSLSSARLFDTDHFTSDRFHCSRVIHPLVGAFHPPAAAAAPILSEMVATIENIKIPVNKHTIFPCMSSFRWLTPCHADLFLL